MYVVAETGIKFKIMGKWKMTLNKLEHDSNGKVYAQAYLFAKEKKGLVNVESSLDLYVG
jgi:hypothetical protein